MQLLLQPGFDVFSLQKLMGTPDLQVLRRYLAQTKEHITQSHRIGILMDNNRLKKLPYLLHHDMTTAITIFICWMTWITAFIREALVSE